MSAGLYADGSWPSTALAACGLDYAIERKSAAGR
jgi:hypothetical protein